MVIEPAVAGMLLAVACTTVQPFQIVTKDGMYRVASSSSCLKLFHGEAEATYVQIVSPGKKPADVPRAQDTTGFAWIGPDEVLFASSPIYGEGGLWLYNLKSRRIEEVGPAEDPSALEYLWTELIAVSPGSVTVRVGGEESIDEAAEPRTFRWVVRPRPLRPHN